MPDSLIVFGPDYSTYTRTVRLVLEEKGIAYTLVPVDFLRGANRSPDHLARHPFGKVPVLQHGDFTLHEVGAITAYIEETFGGVELLPTDRRMRARTRELVGSIVAYIYPAMVGQIVVERLVKPLIGQCPDEESIDQGARRLESRLQVLEQYVGQHSYLLERSITLADLYLIPMWAYFLQTPEGKERVRIPEKLAHWWCVMRERPSVVATEACLS